MFIGSCCYYQPIRRPAIVRGVARKSPRTRPLNSGRALSNRSDLFDKYQCLISMQRLGEGKARRKNVHRKGKAKLSSSGVRRMIEPCKLLLRMDVIVPALSRVRLLLRHPGCELEQIALASSPLRVWTERLFGTGCGGWRGQQLSNVGFKVDTANTR